MTYIPSGGSGGSIATASDVTLSNPQNNETLVFNSGTAMWRAT